VIISTCGGSSSNTPAMSAHACLQKQQQHYRQMDRWQAQLLFYILCRFANDPSVLCIAAEAVNAWSIVVALNDCTMSYIPQIDQGG
jgi:hypothetical protein